MSASVISKAAVRREDVVEAKPSSRIQIEVPCVPVSGNKWQRMHWGARKRINEAWHMAVMTMVDQRLAHPLFANTGSEKPRKVRVETICYFASMQRKNPHLPSRNGKRLDQDNLETGLKPAFDALVKVGLIRDDHPKYLERGKPVQVIERDPKKHRTVFTLELLG